MNIEPLESRIAPAATFTYADVDGDFVTIKTTKGNDGELSAILTLVPEGLGMELREIDFSANAAVFFGTDLTVTAKRTSAGGDGRVNVGYIDATGTDDGAALNVGNARISGDLGRILAGTSSASVAAVKSLTAQSMGEFGLSTQGAGASFVSTLDGALGSLKIAGNVRSAAIVTTGELIGKIGSVTIGGSLLGGSITAFGAMGLVKIGGNLEGTATAGSGAIVAISTLAGVTVGGSILGGNALDSGAILSNGAIGPVKIAGDIIGGDGIRSGVIRGSGALASLTLGGSLLGGNFGSGQVELTGAAGAIKIGGSIIGGDYDGAGDQRDTGFLEALRIASLVIGGSIISGSNTGEGTLLNSGTVRVLDDIGSMVVKGSLIGNVTNPVLITARGQALPGASTDVAIKSLKVSGRVESTFILAGYSINGAPVGINADAQIGTVVVGDWIASSLVAGVQDEGNPGFDSFFGDANDVKIIDLDDAPSITSKIASIVIKGTARGTVAGSDHYGFVAQQIGSFKIGTTAFPLIPGAASDLDLAGYPVGITGDLRIREVPL